MQPTEPQGQEIAGEFEIRGDGTFECRVIDSAGVVSQQAFSAAVTMLEDQSPLIRIVQPEPNSLATPTAAIPVVVSAEDDCGIAGFEVYRNLNDSRPLPAAVRLPVKWPHRHEERITLPLAAFGLAPGDVIRLFGRVEDNDPGGGQGERKPSGQYPHHLPGGIGSDVPHAAGIEALTAKYHEVQRRLEALAKEIEELQKKLEKLSPESPFGRASPAGDAATATADARRNRGPAQVGGQAAPLRFGPEAVARVGQDGPPYRSHGRGTREAL